MARRLFLICVLATAFACKSRGGDKQSDVRSADASKRASAAALGRDAVEKALLALDIDGRVMRLDLNAQPTQAGHIVAGQVHLLSSLILIETETGRKSRKPWVFAVHRRGLQFKWMEQINEPTRFPVTENVDTVFMVSLHYLQALEKSGGRRAMRFVGGELNGLERPYLRLPFRATASAAGQIDTVYVPSLGSALNNKTLETFSLVNGARGWGYRSSTEIFNAPIVGGPQGDPKLYFVTRTGHLTCLDAVNYGFAPRGPRWERLLEGHVSHDMFLTPDAKGYVGKLYLVDDEGQVYCLDRITGNALWVDATGRRPVAGPQVFGQVCVVKMASGLVGYDRDNVIYSLSVRSGNEVGERLWVTHTHKVTHGSGVTFEVQGEVLHAIGGDEAQVRVNGGEPTSRAALYNGDRVTIGDVTIEVADRGGRPLWKDLNYDRVIAMVKDKLVAQRGKALFVLDAWTGEQLGDGIDFSAARFILSNPHDGNLFAVGGDAVIYALFTR